MRDLQTAGRALVDNPPLPPTPVGHIESSARRRRQRRAGIVGAVATLIVLVAAAAGIEAGRRTSPGRVAVGPHDEPAVTDPQMRAHLGLDVPTSWVPVDYGDARLFVPADWKVTAGGCPGPAPAWVEVGGPYKGICGGSTPSTFLAIWGFTEAHDPAPARVVHGYSLYAASGIPDVFVVPALHVTIAASGPLRDEALATLAPSSRLIALTYRRPVPSDWSAVSYAGIEVSVPSEWTQQARDGCGGVPPAQVTLVDGASLGCSAGGLPATGPTRDGIRIGRAQPWFPNTEPKQTRISNGNAAMLLQPGDSDVALVVVVQLNETHGVPVEMGLGMDGRVAAAILGSVRIDGSVSTTTTAQLPVSTDRPIAGVWQPTSIAGYAGPLTSPPLPEAPRLELGGDDRWKGSDGCNQVSGTYRVEKDHSFAITGATVQTQVACVPAKPSTGSVPVVPTYAVLRAAAHLEIAGDQLTFTNSAGRVLATYNAVDIPKPPAAVCTAEPHLARDILARPAATRLKAPRTYSDGQIRLDPPAASDAPAVAPSAVWEHSTISAAKQSTFEIVLARYSYLPVSSNVLAWVVIGHHVPVESNGPGPLFVSTTVTQSGPSCGVELDVFDANTGHAIAIQTFGSN
jgi:heat shock protein HslJ